MKFSELLKLHIAKRLPAAILAVLVCTLFSLYYFGFFDLSFIERPYEWKDNLNMFTELYMPEKLKNEPDDSDTQKAPASDNNNNDETDAPESDTEDGKNNENTPSEPNKENNTQKPPSSDTSTPGYQPLVFSSVAEMKEQGYSLTDKIYDESCIFAKLTTPYAWPDSFSYSYKAYDKSTVITYTDGTESKVETNRISTERPAIDLYMGYIIYDDNGTLYLIGPDGAVLTTYNDSYYIPAYTRDLEGRPLFYRYTNVTVEYPTVFGEEDEDGERPWEETKELKMKVKEYYYLDTDGKTFKKSDYNDTTDNRGLYFDYPSYYGKTTSEFSRYYFNTTKVVTDLKGKTTVTDSPIWTYSKDEKMDLTLFHFDKYGLLTDKDDEEEEEEKTGDKSENTEIKEEKEPFVLPEMLPLEKREPTEEEPFTKEELFPYTMAYNFSEKYATVFMDVDWSYDHDMENDGIKEVKTYDVTTNELRVINEKGEIMFESRKNFFSDLGWTAHEKYTSPLLRNIESLGSYYFDHGLMRVRLQSWDSYHQAQFDMIKVVTDEDILIDPNGKRHELPSGYKLVSYSDGIILLEKDGKYGYMNTSGNWIKDPDMDDAKPFLEGVAVCKNTEGNYGMIDTQGNTLIPFTYDYMSNISGGSVAAYSKATGWTVFQKLSK